MLLRTLKHFKSISLGVYLDKVNLRDAFAGGISIKGGSSDLCGGDVLSPCVYSILCGNTCNKGICFISNIGIKSSFPDMAGNREVIQKHFGIVSKMIAQHLVRFAERLKGMDNGIGRKPF